jgi:hypothetical protein
MIIFTICANNYLPYAGVLCESLKQFHPDWHFILGLVDRRLQEVDYDRFGFDDVIPVEAITIPEFETMLQQYNLVELNTAVKPFFFQHLFKIYPENKQILYFDPDIQVFAPLDSLVAAFDQAAILLVPHFSTPQQGQPGIITPEQRILQRGLYNLGFFGLKQGQTTEVMLDWWRERLIRYCRTLPRKGLFVDQKWIDLVPLFFDEVAILKNQGYDVAYWNLYENHLHRQNGQICTGSYPLRFYHFSAYQMQKPGYLDQLTTPFPTEMAAILQDLYRDYKKLLQDKDFEDFKAIPFAYAPDSSFLDKTKKKIKLFLRRKLNA